MKLQLLKDTKCRGPPPLLSFRPDPSITKKSEKKANSIKVDIKNQPRENDIKTVYLYVPIFNTGSAEARFEITHSNKEKPQGLETKYRST